MKSVGEWIVLENILLDEVNTAYSPSSGVRGSKSLDVSLSPGGMVRRGILGRGLTGHGCCERGNGKNSRDVLPGNKEGKRNQLQEECLKKL